MLYWPVARIRNRLFESDSGAHIRDGTSTFEELEEKLKKVFEKCQEMKVSASENAPRGQKYPRFL